MKIEIIKTKAKINIVFFMANEYSLHKSSPDMEMIFYSLYEFYLVPVAVVGFCKFSVVTVVYVLRKDFCSRTVKRKLPSVAEGVIGHIVVGSETFVI